MRRATIGTPPPGMFNTPEGRFTVESLRELALASYVNDPAAIASEFTISGHTDTRTLDVATATLTDLKNFVATLVLDLARGGAKRGT